jgi:hypothetical protein
MRGVVELSAVDEIIGVMLPTGILGKCTANAMMEFNHNGGEVVRVWKLGQESATCTHLSSKLLSL